MSEKKKIIGVTVGTPTSPKKMEDKINPVKTVNGKAPDENGNVEVEIPGGGNVQNGVSPTVDVTEIEGGHRVTITDVEGDKEFDVMNGKDGKDAPMYFGTCATAAGTVAKTVTIDGFELAVGALVTVKFTATNSAANPTLNVNGTGSYPMIYKGSSVAAYSAFGVGAIEAAKLYQFVFTGANYELVGGLHVDRLAGTSAGYAKSGGDIDFNAGVGTLKEGVVPTKVSELDNDKKYLTLSDLPRYTGGVS